MEAMKIDLSDDEMKLITEALEYVYAYTCRSRWPRPRPRPGRVLTSLRFGRSLGPLATRRKSQIMDGCELFRVFVADVFVLKRRTHFRSSDTSRNGPNCCGPTMASPGHGRITRLNLGAQARRRHFTAIRPLR